MNRKEKGEEREKSDSISSDDKGEIGERDRREKAREKRQTKNGEKGETKNCTAANGAKFHPAFLSKRIKILTFLTRRCIVT